jgi:hypothetical protein
MEMTTIKSTVYPSYGKYNSYYKSKDSNVIVKKIKCNNIHVNLNGFDGIEVDAFPPAMHCHQLLMLKRLMNHKHQMKVKWTPVPLEVVKETLTDISTMIKTLDLYV